MENVSLSETNKIKIVNQSHEPVQWRCNWKVEKRWGDDKSVTPYEIIEGEGNLLMTVGATALWKALHGESITNYYDSTHAYIGVGDSSTAASAGQTDLQAATNKVRIVVDSDPVVSTNTFTLVATFTTSDGNFAWNEWAVFNASTSGTMLNRKVASLGTKTSAASWTFTVTLSLA